MFPVVIFCIASVVLSILLALGIRRRNVRGLRAELDQASRRRHLALDLGRPYEARVEEKKLEFLRQELKQLGAPSDAQLNERPVSVEEFVA